MSNPLDSSTINPAAINDLYAKDPADLSDAEIMEMVRFLRTRREQWAVEEAQSKAKGKRTKASSGVNLSLQDLGDLTLGSLGKGVKK